MAGRFVALELRWCAAVEAVSELEDVEVRGRAEGVVAPGKFDKELVEAEWASEGVDEAEGVEGAEIDMGTEEEEEEEDVEMG